MRSIVTAVLIAVAVLVAAAPAGAHELTPADAVVIGDRFAAEFPQHVNHCSGGRLAVTYDATLEHRGVANGWVLDTTTNTWRWDPTRCMATLRPGMPAEEECWVRAHELMHFVIGPEHVGPLDPRHPGAVECFHGDAHRAFEAAMAVAAAEHAPAPRRLSARSRLIASIRAELPVPRASWSVRCTRNAPSMRCRATSPRARTARSFRARIVRGSVWHDGGRLTSRR